VLRLLDEPYWPASGDPCLVGVVGASEEKVSKQAAETKPVPMFWTYNRGKGRVFGCVPGHFTWTFDDPLFRLVLLRGVAWAAGETPYRFDNLVLRGASVSGGAGKNK
jgi:type 1 glutamine amidotransferase